jgi:hypothetical protein
MRKKSNGHLAYLRSLPCAVCGRAGSQAAHVRYSDPRAGKPITGIGVRPNDAFAVPLCPACHADQHKHGERSWWGQKNIDPIFIALALWQASGDREASEQILRHAYFNS